MVNEARDAHFTCARRFIGRNDLGDDRIDCTILTGAEETPFRTAVRVDGRGECGRGAAEGNGSHDSEARFKQRAARVQRFHITAVRHADLPHRPSRVSDCDERRIRPEEAFRTAEYRSSFDASTMSADAICLATELAPGPAAASAFGTHVRFFG